MKEENDIRKKCGTDNPFEVPAGYFEGFTKQLMEKIPEKQLVEEPVITFWQRSKPWVYMAAMFVGMMFTIKIFVGTPVSSEETPFLTDVEAVDLSDDEVEEMMNYSMIDDYTLYQYLTDATGFDF
ncbi:MAG: hypothetical protein ACRCZY_07325 [Phocaeicola sp.]